MNINKDKILKKIGKYKKSKILIKLSIKIIGEYDDDFTKFIIINKNSYNDFEENKTYITSIINLE